MSLFSRKSPEDLAREERENRSREQLAHGGLTLDAERRLRELSDRQDFFTSNLSVNEFVLAASHGVRPLGQVMGSTVYHVGWQYQPIYQSAELGTLSHAQQHARMLALGRLQQEAKLLGAFGVIGVRLERQSYEWGDNLIEWTARGTAVTLDGEASSDLPFVCALTGQEFWMLRQAGFHPVGFAFGCCVWYHVASPTTQWATQGGMYGGYAGNIELTDYTQAIYQARHAAMTRLTTEAGREGADGVIGVTVEPDIRTYEVELANDQRRRDLVVSFTALGTSIVERRTNLPVIDYALSLSD